VVLDELGQGKNFIGLEVSSLPAWGDFMNIRTMEVEMRVLRDARSSITVHTEIPAVHPFSGKGWVNYFKFNVFTVLNAF